MSNPEKLLPINPQVLLKNKKSQMRKRHRKPKLDKLLNVQNSEDDLTVEGTQMALIVPSKDMEELKNDINKKNILSNLSQEVVEEEVNQGTSTANEFRAKVQQLPTEPMKERQIVLDQISQTVKVFKNKFAELREEVDRWNMIYRKRVVDMNLDVRDYEKKVKKKINMEKSRVAELEALEEKNLQKRLWIERRLAKMILENPEKTLVTTLIEIGFNMVQSMLWVLAMIRDFFRKT